MSGWADAPMAAFDTETTGVQVETARIITACVAAVNDGPIRADVWLADPGVDIPPEATAIHGITTETARSAGRPAADVTSAIELAIGAAWEAGWPVVGFNICYDLTVLDRELRRHHGRGLVIDRHYDQWRRGPRNLAAMCAHYGVGMDGQQVWPELAGMDPAALTTAQAGWHAEWAAQFREYLIGRGLTDDLPDGAWPVRP